MSASPRGTCARCKNRLRDTRPVVNGLWMCGQCAYELEHPSRPDRHDKTREERRVTTNTSDTPAQPELLPAVIEAPPPSSAATLFGTSDPRAALQRMTDVATVLVDVIKSRKLFVRISGHEHITAEGWTTLGAMFGVVPVVEWTRPNEAGDGYLARVEARTLDGRVVGAAESECSRAERRSKTAEPYAIRSMAQTRAIGRALRAPLGQIVVLAGYEPAPAEEMPEPARAEPRPDPNEPTDAQIAELNRLLDLLGAARPEVDWQARAKQFAATSGETLTATTVGVLLDKLRNALREAS